MQIKNSTKAILVFWAIFVFSIYQVVDSGFYGPFYLTIKTPDQKKLQGAIVTLYAKAGTTHGYRATYHEQRLANTGERIKFPRQYIKLFGKPTIKVAIRHPLVYGESLVAPSYLVSSDGNNELGDVEVSYFERSLWDAWSSTQGDINEGRSSGDIVEHILGSMMYSHVTALVDEYDKFLGDLSLSQRKSLEKSTEELEQIVRRMPSKDKRYTLGMIVALKDKWKY